MNATYERDLDLNLLRVFVVVAETGSVTGAADRLYLTQPAISAALARLNRSVGAPLFVRSGRGLTLSARGEKMYTTARPHLEALLEATMSPLKLDPKTSERTIRLGLSDASESWLLPRLLASMSTEAPRMRLIILPVQFRTVSEALATRAVDLAVTVADELPKDIERQPLFQGGFVCLYDPRKVRLPKKLTLERYLAEEHVIVSYAGDLRGVVEDSFGHQRKVRISVPTFHCIGPVVEGSGLLATVPSSVAREVITLRPELKTTALPLPLSGTPVELLWRKAITDDEAIRLIRELIVLAVRPSDRQIR
jgi:LysR family transcriptional activator of mexEF-oprN operon